MQANIFDVLKKEHEKVKGLFKQIKRKKQSPEQLWPEIQKELKVHMEGEEKLFYPYLQGKPETHEITMEAMEEHNVAKKEMDEMMQLSVNDEWFNPKMKVLQELIDHHIEEEETQLFKKAKKVIGREQAQQMAEEFEQEKQRMMAKR
jgi:hemerythrin-like domain-containing protein